MRITRLFLFSIVAWIVMVPLAAQDAAVAEPDKKAAQEPKEYSDAEYKISQALGDETMIEVSEVPLAVLLRELSKWHDIKILIDKRALGELGLSSDHPVTLTAKNVPLGVAMARLAKKLKLTYVVRSNALLLTSTQVAAGTQRQRLIMLAPPNVARSDEIIEAVTKSVRPKSWKLQGGKCEISAKGDKLRIVGQEPLFQEVMDFLHLLDDAESNEKANPE